MNNNIKFDKSFEALYTIAMNMADTCIGNKTTEARFEKLEEEYQELIAEFSSCNGKSVTREQHEALTGELADVLFVLLHIAHKTGAGTAKDLLHRAVSKMLARINDETYIAKN